MLLISLLSIGAAAGLIALFDDDSDTGGDTDNPEIEPRNEYTGTEGNDLLEGSDDADMLDGLGGDDTLYGNGSDDLISGQDGDDLIFGGDGDDTITGGEGIDNIEGNLGADIIKAGAGDDILRGGEGDDNLVGEGGWDVLGGGSGDDTLDGGEGDDLLQGGAGDDSLEGGEGSDYLVGSTGADTLSGGEGNDRIDGADVFNRELISKDLVFGRYGANILDQDDLSVDVTEDSSEADVLDGGDGDDWLIAGAGDTVTGGAGSDLTLVMTSSMDAGAEAVTVTDYDASEDALVLAYESSGAAPTVTVDLQGDNTAFVMIDGQHVLSVANGKDLTAAEIFLEAV